MWLRSVMLKIFDYSISKLIIKIILQIRIVEVFKPVKYPLSTRNFVPRINVGI